MEHILLVPTPNRATGRDVLRALDDLGAEKVVKVSGAAVVVRSADGRWFLPEETEHLSYRGTLTGGAIGALVGLVAGPAGVLLGGVAGLLGGSSAETDDARTVETIVHALGRLIPPDSSAVICDVFETTPEAIDGALAEHGLSGWRMRRRDAEAQLNVALYQDLAPRSRSPMQ